jgi:hypothetical protein
MTHTSTAAALLTLCESIGLYRYLGRRSGRTEIAFTRSPLLMVQFCFEPDDLFLKRIDLPLLLKTSRTIPHDSPL